MMYLKVKNGICILLTVMLILVMLPITAMADTSGDYGYTVSNGEATITSYMGSSNNVSIPAKLGGHPVTAIGNSVFEGGSFTSITIPASVKSIGEYAFAWCYNLKSITIPAGVTSIGKGTFIGCSSLTAIDVASGNTKFASASGVLYNKAKTKLIYCPGSKTGSFTIPSGVTSIEEGAFDDSYNLTAINVASDNKNFTSISGVLYNKVKTKLIRCPGDKTGSVKIPSGVTIIGEREFNGCYKLTSIKIPASVTSIDDWAFASCSELTAIDVASGNTKYASASGVLYNKGKTKLIHCPGSKTGRFTIPASVTSISEVAFDSCYRLTTINVASGNTKYVSVSGVLYNKAKTKLIRCPGEKTGSVEIPSGVTSIGYREFNGCYKLTSIKIPASVTSIDDWAFASCSELTAIDVASGNTKYVSVSGVLYNKAKTKLIHCPGRKTGSVTIPSSVTSINDGAFANCRKVTAINVDSDNTKYTSISGVLYNKAKTKLIHCPRGKTGSVAIPSGVISIRDWEFEGCSSLTSITIPISVKSIGTGAFEGCYGLIAINVDSGNTKYVSVSGVLYNKAKTKLIHCPGSKTGSIKIPASVTSIDGRAFSICEYITTINVASSNTKYASVSGVLYNKAQTKLIRCPGGKTGSVEIPSGVTSIDEQALWGSLKLTSIKVASKNTKYTSVSGVLYNKDKTKLIRVPGGKTGSVTIPTSVTGIEDFAFSSCNNQTSISIPANVKSVGTGAFAGCSKLKKVYFFGNAPTSFGQIVFVGTASGFKIHYITGKSGWKTPKWNGYTTVAEPVPAKPANVQATRASSSSIKISWSKVSGASGYVVYRATSKSGTYSKVTTIKDGSKLSYTNKSLTDGKTYYYKIRAYRNVGGKKVYGSYSSVVRANP